MCESELPTPARALNQRNLQESPLEVSELQRMPQAAAQKWYV